MSLSRFGISILSEPITITTTTSTTSTTTTTLFGGTTTTTVTGSTTTTTSSTTTTTVYPLPYTTDFSEYTTGVNLSDWTDFWGSGDCTFEAEANTGDWKVGTKYCDFVQTANSRKAIVWSNAGSLADADIIAKLDVGVVQVGDSIRLYSRTGGAFGTEDGYRFTLTDTHISLNKYNDGVHTNLVQETFTPKNNTNYYVRFYTVGTALKAKIWAEDAIEPYDWKIEATDSSFTSGYVGFGGYYAATSFKVDYFSVGDSIGPPEFPPTGTTPDTFGYVGNTAGSNSGPFIRAMGGIYDADGALTGVQLHHAGHVTDIQVGVYSGGSLISGPGGATLLADFGEYTSSTSPLEIECPPQKIPRGEPIWIVVKSASDGFQYTYSATPGNSGNFQMDRGICDASGVFSEDTEIDFPDTAPDISSSFSSFWYNWNLTSVAVTTTTTSTTTTTTQVPYPTPSPEFLIKDREGIREPVELYHFYKDDIHWRYTSGDYTVIYEGEAYIPAPITRTEITFDEGMTTSKVSITTNHLAEPVIRFLSNNPLELIWVEIIKVFRDTDPYEGATVFAGTLKNVSYTGNSASVTCTGFEYFLKKRVPRHRYQPSCNYFLFSEKCALVKEDYAIEAELETIDGTMLIFRSSAFEGHVDHYFTWGYMEYNEISRMVVNSYEDTVILRYPFPDLEVGNVVTIYPGCNKKIETCRDKFDNVANFGGFDCIPLYNPVYSV